MATEGRGSFLLSAARVQRPAMGAATFSGCATSGNSFLARCLSSPCTKARHWGSVRKHIAPEGPVGGQSVSFRSS